MEFATSLTSTDYNQIQTHPTGFFKEIQPSTSVTYVYAKPVTSSGQPEGPASPKRVLPPHGILKSRSDKPIRYMRTHFTVYQRRELEKTFSQSKYISPQKRQSLSEELGISDGIIQNWFKNRRVKWRKERSVTGASSASIPATTGAFLHYFDHVPYPSDKLMMRDARMLFGSAFVHNSEEQQYE
ncbi:hypothetical protein ACROYT_G020720 [Oculina patagonica]